MPWTILAGIGTVESDNGQTTLPGVHSGSNAFGAAGPMQIGIGGAAGNVWGGAPVHPASQVVNGVATDEDGGGDASVYDPADAIAGAAKYLLEPACSPTPRRPSSPTTTCSRTCRACCTTRAQYAGGNFAVVSAVMPAASSAAGCATTAGGVPAVQAPNQAVATAITFARAAARQAVPVGRHRAGRLRLLRPGDDGLPDGRDRHRADLGGAVGRPSSRSPPPRSSRGTWCSSPARTAPPPSPGHVGLVIGNGKMIEAYATGFPIRVASYAGRGRDRLHPALGAGGHPATSPRLGARIPTPGPRLSRLASRWLTGLRGISARMSG